MKVTISLTDQQIEKLVTEEAKSLKAQLEKNHEVLEKDYEKALKGLKKKYQKFDIIVDQDVTPKGKFNKELFKTLWNDGVAVAGIAQQMGVTAGYLYIKSKKLINSGEIKKRG